jgi:sulfane dehydrogenase subunit SoxC
MSRAIDDGGAVQPTRAALIGERGANYRYHYHAIQSWGVTDAGAISNVYV